MTRVIGPPKSRRRRWTFLWCLTVALAAGIIFIPGALAVHDEAALRQRLTDHMGLGLRYLAQHRDTTSKERTS